MEIQKESNHFGVEPGSCCFLCMEEILHPSSPFHDPTKRKSETTLVNSLQCLSRYLKMDFLEVLNERRGKADNAKKTKVSVTLCGDCTSLIGKFSKLFSQLEKTEMEVASCMGLIQQKLLKCGKTNKFNRNEQGKLVNYKTEEGLMENQQEVLKMFRKDAIKKGSRKLNMLFPRIKIQKLSPQEIEDEQRKVKSSSVNTRDRWSNNFEEESFDLSEIEVEHIIKLEIPFENSAYENCGNSSTKTQPTIPIVNRGHSDPELFHYEEAANGLPPNLDSVEVDDVVARHQPKSHAKEGKKFRGNIEDGNMPGIDPPIKIVGKNGTSRGQSSINPKTGKHKCRHCSKEFGANKNFHSHYKSVHLKVRYKCRHCMKEFPYKQAYDYHYLKVHLGVRYKCDQCGKIFATKQSLSVHHQTKHVECRYQCSFCFKTFPFPHYKTAHMIKCREGSRQSDNTPITSEDRSNSKFLKCDICHLEVSDLSTHLYAVHFEAEGADLANGNQVAILPPLKVVENNRKAQCRVNEETGKRTCSLCRKEFGTLPGFSAHHKTVHNAERLKCTLCGKLFTQSAWYKHHFRSVHMVATF